MENLKYWIFVLGLIIISFGWYSKFEDTSNIIKERLLSNKEKINCIKNANVNVWYYKQCIYFIKKERGIIPFTYKKIDTLKKPTVKYFSTIYPEDHTEKFNDNFCNCN